MPRNLKFRNTVFLLLVFCFLKSKAQVPGHLEEIKQVEARLSQIEDKDSLGKALYALSIDYREKNTDVLNYIIRRTISHSLAVKDNLGLAHAYNNLGIYYTNLRDADSALLALEKADSLYQLTESIRGQCNVQTSKGNAYSWKREYDKAVEHFLRGIECMESRLPGQYNIEIIRSKSNLGIQYLKLGETQKAEQYWMELYEDEVCKSDTGLYRSLLLNLCILNRRQKRFDMAVEFGEEALTYSTKPLSKARVYNSLASAHARVKNYETALSYYQKALVIQRQLKDSIGIQRTYHNIGFLYKSKGDLSTAKKYFLSSNRELKKRGDLVALQQSFKGLSDLSAQQGLHEDALKYARAEFLIHDSIVDIEKQKAVADFEVKYETEKANREKELAQSQVAIKALESRQNRNRFIGAIAIAGLILLSSIFYFSRMRAQKKAEIALLELKEVQSRLDLEKRFRDSELKALKAQMNPHFVFNVLNSIQDYIMSNQKGMASDYLGKFADLMRNYLHFSDRGSITLQEEIDSLKLYLELEKLRFQEELAYTVVVDDEDDAEYISIPTMLIQPYVENALKHGLLHKTENRKLSIHMKRESATVIACVVEDNGIGRKKSKEINLRQKKMRKSFALKATANRLDLLNHGKDEKISVGIEDLYANQVASGTRVVLKIPILKDLT